MVSVSATGNFDEDEVAAWFGFLTTHSLVTRELDALLGASHGMALVEFEVLLKLSIADGRVLLASLTALGRRRFASARRSHIANVRRLFLEPLGTGRQRVLGEAWSSIVDGLDERPAPRRARRVRPRVSAEPRQPAG